MNSKRLWMNGRRSFVPMVRGYVPPSMQISHALLTILENREDDLRQMRKTSLEACFQTRVSNADNDLGFGRNFFRRRKYMLTDEQRKVLEDWSSKICCHEHVDDGFRRFLSTLHARAQELSALREKCAVWSVKCEVWGLECEGSSEKWEVWSVKCGVWSLKFGVRRVQCAVWGVECRGKDAVGTGCLWTIGHLCLGNFRRRLARVYVIYIYIHIIYIYMHTHMYVWHKPQIKDSR